MSAIRLLLVFLLSALAFGRDDEDDEEEDIEPAAPARAMEFAPVELGYIEVAPKADMGAMELRASAKVGGVQDFASFRLAVMERGEVPTPDQLYAEGLFSEYDLPARKTGVCEVILCPLVEAAPAALPTRPEVAVLAQVGFDTNIDPRTWERPPLGLVVLVDVSGSAGGDSRELARESLRTLAAQLRPQDRVAILSVDRGVRTLLPLTGGDNPALWGVQVDAGARVGSYLMGGMTEAIALAERELVPRGGLVRVIVLSDFLPNLGAVDAESFVALAESGARKGIGMTAVALGNPMGLALAEPISRVRGGNLVTVPTAARAREAFGGDFDTLVTPLAYDFSLEILPAAGWRLVGVYGIPGAALRWDEAGSARLKVSTLFMSNKAGAMYFAFAPETVSGMPAPSAEVGTSIGTIGLAYRLVGGGIVSGDRTITLEDPIERSAGLSLGAWLVEEVEVLSAALLAYHAGDPGLGADLLSGYVERAPLDERPADAMMLTRLILRMNGER